MKVFVAGGSGAVGTCLVPRLAEAGHEVVATTRDSRKKWKLRSLGAEPAVLDALDEDAVLEAVVRAEPEVVVHELTALPRVTNLRRWDREFALTNRLRTEGTDHLIRAAQLAGARRLVAQSFTGWPNIRDGGPLKDELDPLDPDPPAEMSESLAAIRYLERAVLDGPGLEGMVLRYGSLYGPGTAMTNEYAEMVRKRRLPVIGDGAGIWSFVHVDDAAAATVAAVERGTPSVYNIVDDEPAAVSEWLPRLADMLGAKPPRRIPVWLGRFATGEAGVSLMTRIRGSSNAKAKRELGWQPEHTSWRGGFASRDERSSHEGIRSRRDRRSRQATRPAARGARPRGGRDDQERIEAGRGAQPGRSLGRGRRT
jgi:2-alkyl-3-oxoalkanoate reductase